MVLVIEKSAAIRSRMVAMLRQLAPDVAVLESEDGKQTLSLLFDKEPGVVVLDLAQKDMQGGRWLTYLRARLPRAYIVATINDSSASLRDKVRQLGADAVFDKVLEYHAIRAALAESLAAMAKPCQDQSAPCGQNRSLQ